MEIRQQTYLGPTICKKAHANSKQQLYIQQVSIFISHELLVHFFLISMLTTYSQRSLTLTLKNHNVDKCFNKNNIRSKHLL